MNFKILLLLEWLFFNGLTIFSILQFLQYSWRFVRTKDAVSLRAADKFFLAGICQQQAALFLALGSQDVVLFAGTCIITITVLLTFAASYYYDHSVRSFFHVHV